MELGGAYVFNVGVGFPFARVFPGSLLPWSRGSIVDCWRIWG